MSDQSTAEPATEPVAPEDAVPAESVPAPARPAGPAESRGGNGPEIRYNRLFAISDMIAITLAVGISLVILALMGRPLEPQRLLVTLVLMMPVWFVIAYIAGLYSLVDLKISHSLADELGKMTIAVTAWSWLLLVLRTPLVDGPVAMAGPTLRWLLAIPLMLIARGAIRVWSRRFDWHIQPVALIGGGPGLRRLRDRIVRHPEWGLEVGAEFCLESYPEAIAEFAETVEATGVERAVIAEGTADPFDRIQLVSELTDRNLKVDLVSGGPEMIYSNAVLHQLEGLPVLSVRPSRVRPVDLRIKRAFDILASGLALIVVAPLLAWAALRIKLDSPGPVLFRQVRSGYHDREFRMLKLRTMVDGADGMRDQLREATGDQGNDDVLFKLEDDPRITRYGKHLRKWSIDELPQLWNVFRGDMSMVGPRPLPLDEARQASGLFAARARFRPGIAGPWQALGRSSIPFADMIRLDYSYVSGWSMAEDLRLLVRTAVAVLRRTGAH